MKRILISETQFNRYVLNEAAATLDDIYEKYYSTIDLDIFDEIIEADPTYNPQKPDKMGKFGKWLLKLYITNNLKLEDLYKATEYLTVFIRFNRKIENNDIGKYQTLQQLYAAVRPFMENPELTASNSEEIRKIKEGAQKVYEDEKWLVIVPKTKEAACFYGKGTQWCTAATKSNNMFEHYNRRGNLYINIDKTNNNKYQFHFETKQFMDETDTDIETPIYETIGLGQGILDFYRQQVNDKQYGMLISEIKEVYWYNYTELSIYTRKDTGISYLYNEDEEEIVANNLKYENPERLYGQMHRDSFITMRNTNGFITLVTLNKSNELYPLYDLISETLTDVQNPYKRYGIDKDENYNTIQMTDKDGTISFMECESHKIIYSINANNVEYIGKVPFTDLIYVNRKDSKCYDFIDLNHDEPTTAKGLYPIDNDYNKPFNYTQDNDIIMTLKNGRKVTVDKINLSVKYTKE